MVVTFLDLPAEIRLDVYGQLFSSGVAIVDGGIQEDRATLLPAKALVQQFKSCSGQLLRVCRTIQREAEPILYANTHFVTLVQAFAGKLPTGFANGTPFAPKVRHLTWQLNCDLTKHFYLKEFAISAGDVAQLESLELRCQAEAWRGPFCGEWTDTQAFVRGRNQMIEYAQQLQGLMNENKVNNIELVEDRTELNKGRVILRLSKRRHCLPSHEVLID